MTDSGFSFDEDSLSGSLNFSGQSLGESVIDVLQDDAEMVLDYAQSNAPWADRSGLARSGLGVDVYRDGLDVSLVLYHTVDYGLWLETIQSGRFATIMPTLEALAPGIFESINAEFTGFSGEEL